MDRAPHPQRVARRAKLLLGLLALVAQAAKAAPSEPTLAQDFPRLAQLFPVQQPTDYVIAVDRSGSMRRFWPAVLEALEVYLGAIAEGDYVSLVGFGNEASLLATPAPLTPEYRRNLLAYLRRLPPPADARTDLAAGIAAVLRELERPGGAKLTFLVLLTDFIAEPPAGTPYPGQENPESRVWAAFREQAARTLGEKVLDAQALVLDLGDPRFGLHLPAVRQVFPTLTEQLIHDPAALQGWFQRVRAEMSRSKLRAQVQEGLRRLEVKLASLQAKKSPVGAAAKLYAQLEVEGSPFPETQMALEAVSLLDGSQGTCLPPSRWSFRPASTLLAEPGVPGRFLLGEVKPTKPPLLALEESWELCFAGKGKVLVEPAAEIRKLGAEPAIPFDANEKVTLHLPTGRLAPWLLMAFFVLLALVAVVVVRELRPEKINGKLRPLGEQPIAIVNTKIAYVGGPQYRGQGEPFFEIPGALFCLKLQGARRWELGKGMPRGTYVSLLQGSNVELCVQGKRHPLGSTPTLLPYGAKFRGPQQNRPMPMEVTWEYPS